MKLNEFVLLPEDQKMGVLWREAKIIAERKERTYDVFLYQVYSFYVEVWHTGNLINNYKLRSFSSTEELEPYLKKINISGLIYN